MNLTDEQLDILVGWYDKILYGPIEDVIRYKDSQARYFFDLGLLSVTYRLQPMYGKGYVLTSEAEALVERRAGLRLVLELISRGMAIRYEHVIARIVPRLPFASLPVLLTCDDSYVRMLAERRYRKR